jgi:hypothetical protein
LQENDMTPIRNIAAGATMALALLAFAAGPAAACGPEEMHTHFGTVASLDTTAGTVTIVDASTGNLITFKATPAQLASLSPKVRVSIHYAEADGGALVAQEIKV